MAQPAHVPKFGNWDADNVPYTTYFENAHKEKIPGPKNFNPNDPEQNPDAFVSGIFPAEYEQTKSTSSPYGAVTRKQAKYGSQADDDYREVQVTNRNYWGDDNMELSARNNNHRKSNAGSGSDRSYYDSAPRRSVRNCDEDSFQIPPPTPPRMRATMSPRTDAKYDTPSSVPKFGIWDEMDPKAGDGFTIIFNKVKQDKQVAATKLPKVPTDANIYPNSHQNRTKTTLRSKMLGCFSPKVSQ